MIEPILRGLVAQAAPDAGSGFIGLLPILGMFVVIYFLMIRPQQKQARKHSDYLKSLKVGDQVVTNAGIFGRIDAIEDVAVRLEIARDVKIRVLKSQVAGPQPGIVADGGSTDTVSRKN